MCVDFSADHWKSQFIHNAEVIAKNHLKERESTCCGIFASSTESQTARMHSGYEASRGDSYFLRPFSWNILSIGDINIGNTTRYSFIDNSSNTTTHQTQGKKEEAVSTGLKIVAVGVFLATAAILGYQIRKRADHKDSQECFEEIDRQIAREVDVNNPEKTLINNFLLPNLKEILELESRKTNRYALCALAGVIGSSALVIGAFFTASILIPVGQVVIIASLAASILIYMADNSGKKIARYYENILKAVDNYKTPIETSAYYASESQGPIFAEATIVEIIFPIEQPSAPPIKEDSL